MNTAEPDTYIALLPCGCLGLAIVDEPELQMEIAKDIGKAIRQGLKVSRVSTQSVREMEWTCKQHRKQAQTAQKGKGS